MKTVRDQFVPFFSDFLLPSETVDSPFAFQEGQRQEASTRAKPRRIDAVAMWIRNPANRKSAQSLIWIGLVILTVLLSLTVFGVSSLFTKGKTVPACGTAMLWGLLFGIAVLFFLPSKTVITVWGCLLGTSVDKALTGTGILKSASQAIAGAAGIIASPLFLTDQVTQLVLWTFLVTFGLICLPAFLRD
jgi:hypothetical protein